jgi:hypothetical protein
VQEVRDYFVQSYNKTAFNFLFPFRHLFSIDIRLDSAVSKVNSYRVRFLEEGRKTFFLLVNNKGTVYYN